MKCEGSGSKGTRVIERKRGVTDGQTDRRTRQKQYVFPRRGRHNNQIMGRTRFCCKVCCDLDLHSSDQNLARNKLSQYGDHFCEIVLNPTSNNKVMGRT